MEKSFNEDELADIMNEIESLEDEVEACTQEETSEETSEETGEVHSIHEHIEAHVESHPQSQMHFQIEGEMSLSMGFFIQGKEVKINVTDEGLEIGLPDGATFSLPIGEVSEKKKAA